MRAQRRFHRVIALVPPILNEDGTTSEPGNLDGFFLPILNDLASLGPQGDGCVVTPTVIDPASNSKIQAPEHKHRLVLMGVYADGQARVKLMHSLGMTAALGCPYCRMLGSHAAGCTRLMGYSKPIRISRGYEVDPDHPISAQMGEDAKLLITDEQQLQRMRDVEEMIEFTEEEVRRQEIAAMNGVHGACLFVQKLPYLSYNRCFLVPFAHSFYRGVFRDFITSITTTAAALRARKPSTDLPDGLAGAHFPPEFAFTPDQREEIKARGRTLVLTHDFKRPYRDIFKSCRSWTMEDLMRACDVILHLLFIKVWPAVGSNAPVKTLFGYLWRFAKVHMRVHDWEADVRQARQQAQQPQQQEHGGRRQQQETAEELQRIRREAQQKREAALRAARKELLDYAHKVEKVGSPTLQHSSHLYFRLPPCISHCLQPMVSCRRLQRSCLPPICITWYVSSLSKPWRWEIHIVCWSFGLSA